VKLNVGLCEVECNYLSFVECGFMFDEVEFRFDVSKSLISKFAHVSICLCEFDV
jgi:hypothetical protein